ncbi:hypothetical protein GA0070606_2816 [Micromonospora citrea]|uniref:Uncharacterized protein n=1 Tax=Micromonospora citrea TaxID=47855 RepID=A0A1C6UUE5_9ACTN|nr:hypothetical protein GA0070606_2816 [Micromonospora citrea]
MADVQVSELGFRESVILTYKFRELLRHLTRPCDLLAVVEVDNPPKIDIRITVGCICLRSNGETGNAQSRKRQHNFLYKS